MDKSDASLQCADAPRVAVIGGTFNPAHVGHLRLAIEITEALHPARTDLVPCSVPPHKRGTGILPFSMRADLLRAATAGIPGLCVNELEAARPGPSYTYDTLKAYRKTPPLPGARILFVMGLGDFMSLDTWHRGLELPALAELVIVPREGLEKEALFAAARGFWPECAPEPFPDPPFSATCRIPPHGKINLLPLPRLDVSASFIRSHWLAGKSVRFLVPDAVLACLDRNRERVRHCWAQERVRRFP